MTLHVHRLDGCRPTPLAHYLKALAVLRLVSEQRDPTARGLWKEEAFWLTTTLSRDDLSRFFLEDYEPTPILSPWNGGSGFYFREEKTGQKDEATGKLQKTGIRNAPTAATRALESLLSSDCPRLRRYRECAAVARSLVQKLKLLEAPEQEDKARLIALLRSRLPDIRWMDAAVTSLGSDFECAPLVGSGGNDGNEDFSKNFLERVLGLVGPEAPDTRHLLESSLFGHPAVGATDFAPGQFFPGGNGGTNAGAGFSGRPTSNSWEYVLSVEGSLVFAGAASRRLEALTGGATFPFAVRVDPAGYASAAEADRDSSRLEIWLPIWQQPTDLAGVSTLLEEGRARVDRADAQRTTDVARAVASLGTSRGVASFERTGFFTRNGNMHYSVPIGRWMVTAQMHEALLDDIGAWLSRLRLFARDRLAPRSIVDAARGADEGVLAVCRGGREPRRWQALLVALGRAESAVLRSPSKAGDAQRGLSPLPPLSPGWLQAIDDGSAEFRLAMALASQDGALRHDGKETFTNVRAHWMPLDRSRAALHALAERGPARFAADASGLAKDPDVVCTGDDLERDCIALIRRRVQVAPTLTARNIGMIGARGAEASLADVMALLAGEVDDERILALARPLMALKWWEPRPRLAAPPGEGVDAAYALVRITYLSQPLDVGERLTIPLDPEPVAMLAAGNLSGAVAVCLRRLRASGLAPVVRFVAGDSRYARRLAASLAFPIRASDATRCAHLVTKPYEPEEPTHAD